MRFDGRDPQNETYATLIEGRFLEFQLRWQSPCSEAIC